MMRMTTWERGLIENGDKDLEVTSERISFFSDFRVLTSES